MDLTQQKSVGNHKLIINIHSRKDSNSISNDFTLESKKKSHFLLRLDFKFSEFFVISSLKRWGNLFYPTISLIIDPEQSWYGQPKNLQCPKLAIWIIIRIGPCVFSVCFLCDNYNIIQGFFPTYLSTALCKLVKIGINY